MELLKLNTSKSGIAFSEELKQSAMAANSLLHSGKGAGNDFLGWVNLPSSIDKAQLDAITKSLKQIDSNKLSVQQAEKAYNIMQKSFEIGSATFVTLNDAELALTHARLAYSQAIYDFLAGVSDVKKLLGTTDISKYEPQENNK